MWSATLQSDKYQILFIIVMASKFLKIFSESSSDKMQSYYTCACSLANGMQKKPTNSNRYLTC